MTVLRKPDCMTVAQFTHWQPDVHPDRRWQLVDGTPVCMAPASETHGSIQAEAAFLLTAHLLSSRPGGRVVVAPGVVPRISALTNVRVPDLGVTCTAASGSQSMLDPVVLIEILSPSNAAMTRDNVWAYTTIPSVAEILLLGSVAIGAEVFARDADGAWPEAPALIGPQDEVMLSSIGFRAPLLAFYRTTHLIPVPAGGG
jgi:Uma2 family endonuclease